MDAIITGESERVGLSIIDNNDIEHLIEMDETGEIKYHEQDGYPDDAVERTNNENSHVGEARRYAKYYVYREKGYETLPWNLHPDRFETVREALRTLSSTAIEDYFGELLQQSLSHYEDDPSVETGASTRPVTLPETMSTHENAVIYQQEIYLDDDDEVEAVSGILVNYYVAKGERRTDRHGESPDRDPDARIEMSPVPIVAADPLREYLCYNLRCQIRDCYLGMGIEPPEEYRVLGPGQDRFTRRFHIVDRYPEYFDKQATIPGYSYEFTPSSPVPLSDLTDSMATGDEASLYDRVRHKLFTRNG
ncbi:hypothetical protein G6M89_14070 [Natronolimnobius sp. AArcel1]|uniref:hypothetical protein n=1 Tax=Natronolimnobius sp. AArcel1 TaxID=1679093 RepID=UPI0013EBAE96|nr:hypothetical protein [Natronolimnobius sp. AArcel1]NGM70120.1 hypothetical protein [Natronolimnobius sp. AArcel1]